MTSLVQNQEMKLSFRNYLYGVVELSRPLLQNEEFLQSVFEVSCGNQY